jgi:hypothetical protein
LRASAIRIRWNWRRYCAANPGISNIHGAIQLDLKQSSKIKKVPPHRVPSPSLLRASITTAKMISDMSFKPEIPRPNQTRECSHIKAERPTFEIPFKTTFSTSCFYE